MLTMLVWGGAAIASFLAAAALVFAIVRIAESIEGIPGIGPVNGADRRGPLARRFRVAAGGAVVVVPDFEPVGSRKIASRGAASRVGTIGAGGDHHGGSSAAAT